MSHADPPAIEIAVLAGPHAGARYRFARSPVAIGRAADNDAALVRDATLSARHAVLSFEGGAWMLRDAGSKNGTFDAGRARISGAVAIGPKAVFHLGATELAIAPAPVAAPHDPAPPARLRIAREGGSLVFEWSGPDALQARHAIACAPADTVALAQAAAEAVARAHTAGGGGAAAVRETGRRVRQWCVPGPVAEAIDAAAAAGPRPLLLSLDPAVAHVPWEWTAAGDGAWCTAFAMGRQLLVDAGAARPAARHPGPAPTLLFVCDPDGSLPEARAEGEALFETLAASRRFGGAALIAGGRVRALDLLARLERADLVYYLGHGGSDASGTPAGYGWRLDGATLPAQRLAALPRAPWLVFANACGSGREAAAAASYGLPEGGAGMASAFLRAGVAHYLGAAWPVGAEAATGFAASFFEALAAGLGIGEAVRRVRAMAAGDDITPYIYVLYGDPTPALDPADAAT